MKTHSEMVPLTRRFMRRSRIHRFGLVVLSEESEGFVWVPVGHGNVGPTLRTRTAARMNMHYGMWCRVVSTFAFFTKRHFAALLNYMPQVPVTGLPVKCEPPQALDSANRKAYKEHG